MSDWKYRGVVRRDFRATKAGPEEVGGPRTVKKNTKRWCRGKEGLEHDFAVFHDHHTWWRYCKRRCLLCGKDQYLKCLVERDTSK